MRLIKDSVDFWNAMSSLPRSIQIWAILYPLPQVIGGLYYIQEKPGLAIFLGRVISFVIGSQVHRRRPFSKMIGPIGHAHWLLIVPYLVIVLTTESLNKDFYWFIVYVCARLRLSEQNFTKQIAKVVNWLSLRVVFENIALLFSIITLLIK